MAVRTDGSSRDHYEPPKQPISLAKSLQTRLMRADNGFAVPLDKLMHAGERPLLWSVDERMRLIRRCATGCVLVHSRAVFRVRLASGRQLELTSRQDVLNIDGWKPLTELGVGSRIAVVRRLSQPVHLKPMHDSEVIMFAHMIVDGSCHQTSAGSLCIHR
jgi:replicative DNA helicase